MPKNALITRPSGPWSLLGAGALGEWLFGRKPSAQIYVAPGRELAFTFAVIGLCAKLIKCDGVFKREEFLTFREAFPLDDAQSAKLRQLFTMAWQDELEPRFYARQIAILFPDHVDLRLEVLEHLAAIALADGPVSEAEQEFLQGVASAMGFSRLQLSRLLSRAVRKADGRDPFAVLGVGKRAAPAEIKAQYIALMRRFHPDRLSGAVAYPEALAAAERRAANVTQAYHAAMKKRVNTR